MITVPLYRYIYIFSIGGLYENIDISIPADCAIYLYSAGPGPRLFLYKTGRPVLPVLVCLLPSVLPGGSCRRCLGTVAAGPGGRGPRGRLDPSGRTSCRRRPVRAGAIFARAAPAVFRARVPQVFSRYSRAGAFTVTRARVIDRAGMLARAFPSADDRAGALFRRTFAPVPACFVR